jgi:hypothetical protein
VAWGAAARSTVDALTFRAVTRTLLFGHVPARAPRQASQHFLLTKELIHLIRRRLPCGDEGCEQRIGASRF